MINYLLSLRAYNVNMWIFSHRKARCMALVLPWRRQQNFPCFELLNLRLRFRDLAVPSLYGVGEGKNHKVKKERRKKQDDESAANIKALRAMFLPSLSRAASLRNLISRKENFLASKCRRFSRRKLSFRKKKSSNKKSNHISIRGCVHCEPPGRCRRRASRRLFHFLAPELF